MDARSDVWSLGATLYRLFSGSFGHGGRTPNEELVNAMTKSPASLREVAPSVPVALCDVVDWALAFEKKDRWTDATAMQAAVRKAYSERHSGPITTATRPIVPESAARGRAWRSCSARAESLR